MVARAIDWVEGARERVLNAIPRWCGSAGVDSPLLDLHALRAEFELLWFFDLIREVEATLPVTTRGRPSAFETLNGLPRGAAQKVFSSPQAIYWSRQCRLLLQAGRMEELLVRWEELQLFLCSVVLISSERYGPVEVHLRGTAGFPALGVRLEGIGEMPLLLEVGDSRLIARQGEVEASWPAMGDPMASLSFQSVFRLAEGQLVLDPGDPIFREVFPWLQGEGSPIDEDGWLAALGDGLTRVRRFYPEMHTEMMLGLKAVVPTSRSTWKVPRSSTHRDLWGVCGINLVPEPALSAGLIHEYRHNLLHGIQLLEEVVTPQSCGVFGYYSPWRGDLRPASGVFHAIFVFVAVVEYYRRLLDRCAEDPALDRGELLKRLGANVFRLRIAVAELEESPDLSSFGRRFLGGLANVVEQQVHSAASRGALHAAGGGLPGLLVGHYQAWRNRWGRVARSDVERTIAETVAHG